MPTALNSLQPFQDMDYTKMLERLLLLAVSIMYCMYTVLCIIHVTVMCCAFISHGLVVYRYEQSCV